MISEPELATINIPDGCQWVALEADAYTKAAYRGGTEGVMAIAQTKTHALTDLKLPKENPLILVAEAPEKPGKIGDLLR